MKYSKSAFPYLTLLILLLIAIPFRSCQLEEEQTISISVEPLDEGIHVSPHQYVEILTIKN